MRDENDRDYVRSAAIPEWMASGLGKILPLVLVAGLGSGFVLWQQFAVLANRVERLEGEANKGERFTAKDGQRVEARINALENWREEHTRFGWEKTLEWNGKINELDRMCRENCK